MRLRIKQVGAYLQIMGASLLVAAAGFPPASVASIDAGGQAGELHVSLVPRPLPGGGESIKLEYTGAMPIDISGWSIHDDIRRIYTFDEYTLEPHVPLWMCSDAAVVPDCEIDYISGSRSVWNDTGDTLSLFDADQTLIAQIAYTRGVEAGESVSTSVVYSGAASEITAPPRPTLTVAEPTCERPSNWLMYSGERQAITLQTSSAVIAAETIPAEGQDAASLSASFGEVLVELWWNGGAEPQKLGETRLMLRDPEKLSCGSSTPTDRPDVVEPSTSQATTKHAAAPVSPSRPSTNDVRPSTTPTVVDVAAVKTRPVLQAIGAISPQRSAVVSVAPSTAAAAASVQTAAAPKKLAAAAPRTAPEPTATQPAREDAPEVAASELAHGVRVDRDSTIWQLWRWAAPLAAIGCIVVGMGMMVAERTQPSTRAKRKK
ncbi:hypothetical protein CR983_03025 [Candidatus Saccharibacteria bacterium]|nr:MAG: hypothetical protein CR983_03025 [Candidatus Saccharibacteria bacterium]